MGTFTNLQIVSVPLGLLGIVASLLLLVAPRPQVMGSGIYSRGNLYTIQSDGTCIQYVLNPNQTVQSVLKPNQTDRNCLQLQLLFSLDGGFSDTVDKVFGFPDTVAFASIIHILANASLLYGAFQFRYGFVWVYILHFILTFFGTLYVFLSYFDDYPYESQLFAMCLWPLESLPVLFTNSVALVAIIIWLIRGILIVYIEFLVTKIMDDKEKFKPAPQKKMHDDKVVVIPV